MSLSLGAATLLTALGIGGCRTTMTVTSTGFNPCDPSRAVDPRVAAVCSRIEKWNPQSDACNELNAACESAGYYIGGSPVGRGLLFNCLTPLLLGDDVPGVEVDRRAPAACMMEGHGAQVASGNRGFNPCDPNLAGDSRMDAVCSRINHWNPPTGACSALDTACKTAGYYVGGYVVGKGLLFDCLTPLLLGSSVPGIEVDARVSSACMTEGRPQSAGVPGAVRQ